MTPRSDGCVRARVGSRGQARRLSPPGPARRRRGSAVHAARLHNWTGRYPAIAVTAMQLRARSFTLDGEGCVCGPDGVAIFDALHRQRTVSARSSPPSFAAPLRASAHSFQVMRPRRPKVPRLSAAAPVSRVYALNTRCFVIGSTVSRLPIALKIALAMAGGTGPIVGSPAPHAGTLLGSCVSCSG
jgi:hypothetical protein